MRTRIGVAIVAVTLALYIYLVGQRAVLLVASGDPVGIAMGVALVLLPVVAIWALWRELSFGAGAERLGRRLEAEGALPAEELTLRPSGRPVQAEVDALFPAYRDAVEADPADWRAWYRLGLLYDGAGDRRRARDAIRTAISHERAERRR
ncbi:tetratricopeptide repeat protein [Microbacterium aquilitoris]|uniref:tetratricopeptide repeat protein n=1 Tax=Microbacterium aquilitoris TaxID=3067307 RepID=UPI00288EE2A2|nr:tetratricopeptide repeat protein [Microbacterium sp. KSW2-22]MDT3346144.1 tetratricopeptide repeat protein [Microbacterium sp. KSW2-22]